MTRLRTRLTDRLQIVHPVIQAGMAGGVTTPELVAAVSNAGGLGTLGAGYMNAKQIESAVARIRVMTDRPFGVNLFIPEPFRIDREEIDAMQRVLSPLRQELGVEASPDAGDSEPFAESFDEQIAMVVDQKIPVFSCTFGVPGPTVVQRLKRAGICVMGTATTVREGVTLEQAGVDVIVAQGSEAGGHRGTFAHAEENALIGTLALVPQMVDAVSVPVVAAGGVMEGRGLAACLVLGAEGVQMGTAFLACPESGAHRVYKETLLATSEDSTALTRVYSGKAARGIVTEFMRRMASYGGRIPPYPVQNALTRGIRAAAARADNPAFMALWAGQGVRMAGRLPAFAVVEQTVREAAAALQARIPAVD